MQDVSLVFDIGVDILMSISVSMDGVFSLFTPILASMGFTGTNAILTAAQAVDSNNDFFEVFDPWTPCDWTSALAAFAGALASTPRGMILWGIIFGIFVINVIYACIYTYQGMLDGNISRFGAGGHIMERGMFYMMMSGAVPMAGGIIMQSSTPTEKSVSDEFYKDLQGDIQHADIDELSDELPKCIISGLTHIIFGVVLILVGAMITYNILLQWSDSDE